MNRCERCHQPIHVGDWPFCPHGQGHSTVIGDECDVWQENGFPVPRRFRSKLELKRALAERGLEMRVRHMPLPGTDKSPHTTDWSRMMDPQTLENARILVSRGTAVFTDWQTMTTATIPVTWTIQEHQP